MKEILHYYSEYNVWANEKMANFFSDKEEEKLTQFIENSFPSIRRTVEHMITAERSWLARLQNDTNNNNNISLNYSSTNQAFMDLLAYSRKFSKFVSEQSEFFFQRNICYHTWNGDPWEMQPKVMIHHCMNHSTYHRGQLITMARQLGWKSNLPSTDILFYWRETSSNSSMI